MLFPTVRRIVGNRFLGGSGALVTWVSTWGGVYNESLFCLSRGIRQPVHFPSGLIFFVVFVYLTVFLLMTGAFFSCMSSWCVTRLPLRSRESRPSRVARDVFLFSPNPRGSCVCIRSGSTFPSTASIGHIFAGFFVAGNARRLLLSLSANWWRRAIATDILKCVNKRPIRSLCVCGLWAFSGLLAENRQEMLFPTVRNTYAKPLLQRFESVLLAGQRSSGEPLLRGQVEHLYRVKRRSADHPDSPPRRRKMRADWSCIAQLASQVRIGP